MLRTRAVVVVLSSIGFAAAMTCAQTPITSLPRPSGTTSAAATPSESQYPEDTSYSSTSYSSVHPITSLPRPPGASTVAATPLAMALPVSVAPEYNVPEYTVPVPVVDTAPAAISSSSAPVSTTGAPVALSANATAYALPGSAPARAAAPPAPTPTLTAPLRASTSQEPIVLAKREPQKVRPFSTFAIQFKIGTNGIGFDAAVPLAQHFDFRAGGNIFSYGGSYDDSGDDITGTAQFRSGEFYLDYYPFSHGPLRLSAGMVINGSYLNATTLVKSGQQFDLNNTTYYSSATDPVHGTAAFSFGHEAAPSFTIGLGSMIPRTGKHISFPFEVGFMYVGDPALSLTLMGTVCDTNNPPNCQKIDSDPAAQANLKQEVNTINSDIHFLRFFPILSQGIAFKF